MTKLNLPLAALSLLLVIVVFALLAAAGFAQEGTVQPRPPEKRSPAELIERLHSSSFKVREEAARALLERDDALAAVRQALHSEDGEVRLRAKRILAERNRRNHVESLKRLPDLIKNGEVDSVVDLMYSVEDSTDEKAWQAITALVNRILAAGSKKQHVRYTIFDNIPANPGFSKYRLKRIPPLKNLTWMRDVVAEVKGRDHVGFCVYLSQGQVQAEWHIRNTVIFANGDVSVTRPKCGGLQSCLIICDGSIKAYTASGCILIATGSIDVNPSSDLVIQNCREALGLIKFYDAKQAGVEVAATGGRVVVKKVLEGKPFARAGLRVGDVILAVGGTKVCTEPEFRRLVRRADVLGADTTLAVERKGKGKLELQVVFKHR